MGSAGFLSSAVGSFFFFLGGGGGRVGITKKSARAEVIDAFESRGIEVLGPGRDLRACRGLGLGFRVYRV